MDDNPAAPITRADLRQQLEVNARVAELQFQIANQQEDLIERLDRTSAVLDKVAGTLSVIERRTWKTQWLFWGLIGSLLTTFTNVAFAVTGA